MTIFSTSTTKGGKLEGWLLRQSAPEAEEGLASELPLTRTFLEQVHLENSIGDLLRCAHLRKGSVLLIYFEYVFVEMIA